MEGTSEKRAGEFCTLYEDELTGVSRGEREKEGRER